MQKDTFLTSKKTIENFKLIRVLKSFSALEWKRFGRFVQSPYHNTNQSLIKFYEVLKKRFPFEEVDDLEQERLFKKVYKKEKFNAAKFQNLCSNLYLSLIHI